MNSNHDSKNIALLDDDAVFALALRNPEAFSEIVDRYQKAFLRKANLILKDEQNAYDIVQETFVRIYSKASQYKKQEGATFKSWAYRILINQCCTLYQKNKKERLNTIWTEDDTIENIADPYATEAIDQKLTKEYVVSLVSRLPALLSRVVTLHFLQHLPQKQVAEIEGVSNEVVRARIHRAKKELRKLSAITF